MRTLTVLAVTALVLGACAPAGSGGAATAPPTAAATAAPTATANPLYEAAKKEGKVVFYAADTAEARQRLQEGFSAVYPGIEILAQEGQGRDTREKIIAESAAGKVLADVVSAGGNTMADLAGKGLLESYQSPHVKDLLPGIADKRGFVNPRYVNVYGITVNTSLIGPQDEPKRWKDLADPKYKGQIAMQDPRGSGGGLYVMTGLLATYGESFLADLAKQEIAFGRNNPVGMTDVVRGERAIHMSASANDSLKSRTEGAPIKFIQPEEGVVLIPIGLAVVKGGPNPNAARLFIDWLLSEAGQKVTAEDRNPARKGVAAKDAAQDLSNGKVLVMEYDGSDRQETADLSKKYEAIFFAK